MSSIKNKDLCFRTHLTWPSLKTRRIFRGCTAVFA